MQGSDTFLLDTSAVALRQNPNVHYGQALSMLGPNTD